ncbi:MAG: hypothetical protein WAP03_23045 [Methylorubrum rhodinum]|uniref:hypothetical protein n=1 Tax=Methylorubrum rhodinum TaxID=29428 RepID=UPI003BB1111B
MGTDHRKRIEQVIARYEAGGLGVIDARVTRQQLRDGPGGELARLRTGEARADDVEYALAYLELDPFYFRSGYTRNRVAGHLSLQRLDETQRERARALVRQAVDGARHTPFPGIARLAGSVADNALRRALRARLHSSDPHVARRALRTLVHVKRPGYTPADIGVARRVIVAGAGRWQWLTPEDYRLATRFWTHAWEAELRDVAQDHGPERAGATRLLEAMVRRHERSEEKRAGL